MENVKLWVEGYMEERGVDNLHEAVIFMQYK